MRDGSFACVSDADVAFFRSVLGERGVVTDAEALRPYNEDWLGQTRGAAALALRPRSTKEVSRVLAHCHERRLAVVPQGGNTGLVGGSVPAFDEVVLSLSAMDRVLAFDEDAGVLTCEAGCVLEALDNWLAERGHMMPIDLGAKGSCQIGGNVATNAGGVRLLRYGSLRGTVLGVRAVLADAHGTVLEGLSTLRKDNTGYALPQLFVGSEGTLGVITAVSLLAPRRPAAETVSLLACEDFGAVLRVLSRARAELCEILSAAEFLDGGCAEIVRQQGGANGAAAGAAAAAPSLRLDGKAFPFYVLLETAGSVQAHDAEKLDAFLEGAMGAGDVADGVVAGTGPQAAALWALREGITPALTAAGRVLKYDVSLPTRRMYDLVPALRERLRAAGFGADEGVRVVGFGHVGDGNLHLNVSAPRETMAGGGSGGSGGADLGGAGGGADELLAQVEPFVFEWVADAAGSISAEHGVGRHKRDYMTLARPPAMLDAMRALKAQFDPRGILNPYKLLPPRQ
eukprot:g2765.t1